MSKVGREELQKLSAMGQGVADSIKYSTSSPGRITAAGTAVSMYYLSYIADVLTDIRDLLEKNQK